MIAERIDPNHDEHVARLCRLAHLKRYRKAAEFAGSEDIVLDAGSGSGYGSAILAESASRVIAVDNSPEAIEYASERYPRDNIEYILGDLTTIDLSDFGPFDVIAFFEVVEHLNEPQIALQKLRDTIHQDGHLLLSTPNGRYPYLENPYHTHEYTEQEVLGLLYENGFDAQEVLGQYPILGVLAGMVKRASGDPSSIDRGFVSSRGIVSSVPFVPEIFSRLYKSELARATSRQLFFVARRRE